MLTKTLLYCNFKYFNGEKKLPRKFDFNYLMLLLLFLDLIKATSVLPSHRDLQR